MTVITHPEARVEYVDAATYYTQVHRGLGKAFRAEIRSVVDEIRSAPTRWRCIEQDVRRCWVRQFPFAVIYTIEQDEILVVAIMHTSREPGYWHGRLPSKS